MPGPRRSEVVGDQKGVDSLEVLHDGVPTTARSTGQDAWGPEVVDLPVTPFEPRPTRAEYYVADTVLDGWETPALTLRLASVRGYGHRFVGSPRQDDAVAHHHASSGAVVIAVADGVSSAPLSHHGARLAVRTAARAVMDRLDSQPVSWETVFEEVTSQLERLAERRGTAARDAAGLLGTTLVVALVRPTADGFRAHLAWTGDSGAWAIDSSGGFHAIVQPKSADGVSLVTPTVRALPQRQAPIQNCIGDFRAGEVLLIGTDGIGDPLGDGTGLVGDLFSQHLESPPPPLRFAHLVDFSRETFDDDRTLVAVWPRPPIAPDRPLAMPVDRGFESTVLQSAPAPEEVRSKLARLRGAVPGRRRR